MLPTIRTDDKAMKQSVSNEAQWKKDTETPISWLLCGSIESALPSELLIVLHVVVTVCSYLLIVISLSTRMFFSCHH